MKNIRKIVVFAVVLSIFGMMSCQTDAVNESKNAEEKLSPKIKNIKTIYSSENSNINLSWTNPTVKNFDHISICYSANDGAKDSEMSESVVITGDSYTFDANSTNIYYTFYFKALDVSDNQLDETVIKVKIAENDASEGFVKILGGTVKGEKLSDHFEGVFVEGRTVSLDDFLMSKYEITQAEYESVMENQNVVVFVKSDEEESSKEYGLEANPSCCTEENKDVYGVNFGSDYGKRPVENVTWYDAVFYCNARSEKEGLNAVYKIENPEVEENHIVFADVTCDLSQNGYRLPTEAEWEYAAHGGNNPSTADWNYIFSGIDTDSGTKYDSNFNSALDSVGWYCYNNKDGTTSKKDSTTSADGCGTHEVGLKAANVLGLYDMSGNVFEWCWDIFDDISSETVDNPLGPDSGNYRVGRGGSWNVNAKRASVAFRMNLNPRGRSSSIGFRVVRNCEN